METSEAPTKPIVKNFLWVYWFLGKNLSNFIPPVWKLHNLYCYCPGKVIFLEISCLFLGKVKFELDFSFFQFAFFSLLRILALDKLCRKTTQHFEGATKYERETRHSGAESKLYIPSTSTPWLTLLLVLGKSRVKQNSC